MNDAKLNFIQLAKEYEKKQEEMNELRVRLNSAMLELQIGTYVQCPDTGTVYKIVKPNGTFTYYKDIDYVRTALEGERAGTLSKKEAEGSGFVLKK